MSNQIDWSRGNYIQDIRKGNIQKSYSNNVGPDPIEKGGEGSKGGVVMGHTASGKPIYADSAWEHNTPPFHSEHLLNEIKHKTGDKTLHHDDYDANDRPIYVSKKKNREHIEHTVDEHGNLWKHDGMNNHKIGSVYTPSHKKS